MTYTGIYRDGLRQGGGNFAIPKIEPYGLETCRFSEDPASGLYGLGSRAASSTSRRSGRR